MYVIVYWILDFKCRSEYVFGLIIKPIINPYHKAFLVLT